jgi:hypothetical protein
VSERVARIKRVNDMRKKKEEDASQASKHQKRESKGRNLINDSLVFVFGFDKEKGKEAEEE